MLDLNEREQAIKDIEEEIDVVLSIKEYVSQEEIESLAESFKVLTEKDIRELLVKITGNSIYIDNWKYDNKITEKNEDSKNEDITEESENIIEEKVIIEEKIVADITNIQPKVNAENITFIREEVKYNQLCIEWDWPIGIYKVLVCYRNDKFPLKPEDKDCNKILVEKHLEEKIGEFIINKLKEESYYFWIFPIINEDGNIKYLQGKKRLVVNKAIVEICYELKVKKSLLGTVKSVKILLKTNEEEVTLPPTVLVAKKGSVPIYKSDGNEVYKFDYIKIGKASSGEIDIPVDRISKNTYVKLFIEDEKSSGLFRIMPPKKEQMLY